MTRNIAIIVLDCVRKDIFDRTAMRLRNMADVEYTSCRSASSWSVPSHASMFTGQLPSEHGVHTYSPSYESVDDDSFVTNRLDVSRSISVTANQWTDDTFGWDNYFHEHEYVHRNEPFPEGCGLQSTSPLYLDYAKRALRHDYPVKSLLNGVGYQLLQQMENRGYPRLIDKGAKRIARRSLAHVRASDEPWFLFNNFFDVHHPLHRLPQFDDSLHTASWSFDGECLVAHKIMSENHPQTFNDIAECLSTTRDLYVAAIDYLDRVVSEYVERLCEATSGETTVIITADHGENLGYETERGHLLHDHSMTDALLHVPLLVINPPESAPSGRVDGLVSHLDLPELIVAIADDEWSAIERDTVVAERISSLAKLDKYPWIEPELDWWTRSIRRVYRGERSVEWDTEGNIFEWEHDKEVPSSELLVGCLDAVPDEMTECFDVDIDTYRKQASDQEEMEVSSSVAENLENMGYL